MQRSIFVLGLTLVLAVPESLAQRSVGVRARQPAGAKNRVALMIGNSAYGRSMGLLNTPANDAEEHGPHPAPT